MDLTSFPMSKQTQTLQKQTQTSENFYDVYKQNVEKYFENAVDSVPQNLQSFASIQLEWYNAWKTTVISVISLQKEFAAKTGINTDIPEAAKTAIVDANKQIIKAKSVQNQIVQATASAIQKNIQTWNNSAGAFTDLNKNILQSWISTFTQPKN
ncbi:hypothetical protein AAA799E16_01441 [Marine Group I thaumarchaeote SCGC AAA799-E16]|uniref:Phasin protein n=4 Tax=Marine Group I TaxID=905826 RepID=A0A081RNS7_9ARCH|nr:hypothetical protein AAA799N04_00684 [Marine Group I thaumarchaeote SCGC AAA799-N04]KER05875.1 hypothetical protein AAA799E16_01441 [Marine Group I thaumarchaeote SCGC AAA799-E16]KFM16469.1 hypothetical protein SCCGRSA3_02253 [Marine Group I thaumarchaeote SCGC RSA3]